MTTATATAAPREIRMRSAPAYGFDAAQGAGVDRVNGVLRGVSAIQAVEALGHGMTCDDVTLQQVADGINTAPGGIKVRFTHPGMCEDGTGKLLGKGTNARVDSGKVLFDVKLAAAAKSSPQGNLWQHVVDLATESPSDVGFSIAGEGRPVWKLADGSEVPARNDDGPIARPNTAVGDQPRFRLSKLRAVDLVDEPAANRDGLFADTSSALGEEAFHSIDRFLQQNGLTAERAHSFAQRYFAARGVTATISTAGNPPASTPASPAGTDPMKITAAVLLALVTSHQEHLALISSMASGDPAKGVQPATEDEIRAAINLAATKATAEKLTQLEARLTEMAAAHVKALAVKDAEAAELKTKLADITAKHDAIAKLSTGAAKDPGSAPEATTKAAPAAGDKAALKAKWDKSDKLRAEFGGQFDLFEAFTSDPGNKNVELPE